LHPKKGMIYPDMFIPIFERNGKIYNLDVYVFEEVCRIVAQWMEQGKEIIEISVNISRFTLLTARKDIWEKYRQIKEKYGIPDGIIEIELTETVLM
ncbi:EAL domain-containing protein, partial [Acinetobacter baumannii]|nr:EAL domain-containing protein [Acinetobacter baumannii]